MVGEPFDLKPSTSRRDRPPDQTVAPNDSTSGELGPRKWKTLMPHDGSGTRSGRDLAGGLVRVGTLAGNWGRAPCGTGCRLAGLLAHGNWHALGLTTLILTVLVEACDVKCRNRFQNGMMRTVTVYLPRASFGKMNAASTPQPRWIPQALLSWNGSDWHTCGKGDLLGAFGLDRCGNELGQNGLIWEAMILPPVFRTVMRMKRCSPSQPGTVHPGSGRRMLVPPGPRMICVA